MKRAKKKTARRLAPSSGRVQGLAAAKRNGPRQTRREYAGPAPRTICKIIIPNSRENASPNLDGGGGALPMSGWVLALTIIGTGWLTGQLFRLIDWIER